MPFALRTSLADIENFFFHRVDGAGRKKYPVRMVSHMKASPAPSGSDVEGGCCDCRLRTTTGCPFNLKPASLSAGFTFFDPVDWRRNQFISGRPLAGPALTGCVRENRNPSAVCRKPAPLLLKFSINLQLSHVARLSAAIDERPQKEFHNQSILLRSIEHRNFVEATRHEEC